MTEGDRGVNMAEADAAEVEDRAGSGAPPGPKKSGEMRDEGLRWFSRYIFRVFTWPFEKSGMSPNSVTVLGMAVAVASGYFIAVGNVPLGAVLFALSGILDIVDGEVAKRHGRVTNHGAFLDSFCDRVSDAAIYLGIAVLYMRRGEGVFAGLALVVLITALLFSYTRAKAESMMPDPMKEGFMARAPRYLLVGFGLFFNGLSPWVLRSVLIVAAPLMAWSVVSRLREAWKRIEEAQPADAPVPDR